MLLSRTSISAHSPRLYLRLYAQTYQKHNQGIVDLLEQCKAEEESSPTKNAYKIRSFSKAIAVVSKLDYPIQKLDQAKALTNVGPSIRNRIDEYLLKHNITGDLSPAHAAAEMLKRRAKQDLKRVPQLGDAKAQQLVDAGCKGIVDLSKEKYFEMLTPTQKLGFKYMDHFSQPITRSEAESVASLFRGKLDNKFEVILVGSYRRGASNFPTIDILILHPSYTVIPIPTDPPPHESGPTHVAKRPRKKSEIRSKWQDSNVLHSDVIPILEKRGLIDSSSIKVQGTWNGVIRLSSADGLTHAEENAENFIYRRLNIHMASNKSQGAKMISLTGDKEFLRDIRKRAHRMGLLLDDAGLWKWCDNQPENEIVAQSNGFWSLIKAPTESDIFIELGMEAVPPEKRNYEVLMAHRKR